MMNTDFRAKHSLGQNFLVDKNVLNFIIERSNTCVGDIVLEIGPGQAVLTQALLSRNIACLHAVEFDERLRPVLEPIAQRDSRLTLHWGDVMKLNLCEFKPFPTKAIANIPYNITTPLLWKLLPLAAQGLRYFLFMVQSEAADRLVAAPDTKERYPLGVALEVMGKVSRVKSVAPTCFRPIPRVDSALIEIVMHDKQELVPDLSQNISLIEQNFELWRDLLHRGFAHRRKTLLNNLKGFRDLPQETWLRVLACANIEPTVRAEDLSGSDWVKILKILSSPKEF